MQVPEIIVGAILAIVIVADVPLPQTAQTMVSSTPGIVVVLGLALYLFSKNPILGVLGAIAGFMLIRRTSVYNPSRLVEPVLYEKERTAGFVPNIGETLEEQIVQSMVPMVR